VFLRELDVSVVNFLPRRHRRKYRVRVQSLL